MNNILKKFIEDRVEQIPESGCWIWTKALNTSGYGWARHPTKKTNISASRIAYEAYFGEIENGKSVLHKCDIPSCCNPSHLFSGTQKENIVDRNTKGRNPMSNKKHCKNGHEFTDENTHLRPSGHRTCKKCQSIRMKKWKAKRNG